MFFQRCLIELSEAWNFFFWVRITSFSKTTLLQREPFLTMVILSTALHCSLPRTLHAKISFRLPIMPIVVHIVLQYWFIHIFAMILSDIMYTNECSNAVVHPHAWKAREKNQTTLKMLYNLSKISMNSTFCCARGGF